MVNLKCVIPQFFKARMKQTSLHPFVHTFRQNMRQLRLTCWIASLSKILYYLAYFNIPQICWKTYRSFQKFIQNWLVGFRTIFYGRVLKVWISFAKFWGTSSLTSFTVWIRKNRYSKNRAIQIADKSLLGIQIVHCSDHHSNKC